MKEKESIAEVKKNEIKISKKVFVGVIALLILGAIGVGLFIISPVKLNIGNSEGKVVATVNGQAIYDKDIEQTKRALESQSPVPVTTDAVLESTIINFVLLQKAEDEGIEVTENEAEKQIIELLSQNSMTLEQFKSQLSASGVEYKDALASYVIQLKIQKLITKEVGLRTISDKEAMAFYEENKETLFPETEAPDFESISSQLKQFIQQQESQQAISQYIKEARDSADVEIIGSKEPLINQ